MMRPFSLRWLIPFALVALLLSACGGSTDAATDTTLAATTTESETTTTTAATTTAAPTTTTVAEPAVTLPGPGEPWDLVVIGNEYDFGESFLESYADSASEVLGVDVNATYAGVLESTAWEIVDVLRGDAYPDIGALFEEPKSS